MEIVLKKGPLKNDIFQKLSYFKKLVVFFVNDDPSLTIVNEERRGEETDLKGIGTYH